MANTCWCQQYEYKPKRYCRVALLKDDIKKHFGTKILMEIPTIPNNLELIILLPGECHIGVRLL